MAPPTKYARLDSIDPEQLGKDVSAGVRAHIARLCFDVGQEARDAGPDNLALSVADLARYAQTGKGLDAPVEEYLTTIAPPVWTRAYDGSIYTTPEFDAPNPDSLEPDRWQDQLVLVMRAALAREKLDHKQPLSPAELAILASMAGNAVRLMCQQDKLEATNDGGWKISAKVCKAFLKARS